MSRWVRWATVATTATALVMLAIGTCWGAKGGGNGGKKKQGNPVEIEKNLLAGPYLLDPYAIYGGAAYNSVTVEVDSEDAGGVVVGMDRPQHFIFNAVVTETAAVELDLLIYDVLPAEFNLDPYGEDYANDSTFNAVCADSTCDGIQLSGGCDGFFAYQPPGADAGKKDEVPFGQRWKEPEMISVLFANVADGESCTVTVYAVTDGNPGHVQTDAAGDSQCITGIGTTQDCVADVDDVLLFDLYSPSSCPPIYFPDDATIAAYDTISLNDGVKVFQLDDPSYNSLRLHGPDSSLQLTPNGWLGGFAGTQAACATP